MSTRRIMLVSSLLLACGALLVVARRVPPAAPRGSAPDAPPASPGPAVAPDLQRRLEALGYTERAVDDPDPTLRGVTLREPRAGDGVNVYCTGRSLRFVAMDGALLEEIPLDIAATPNSGCLARPYHRGLVTVVRSPILSLLDLSGKARWSRLGPFHHDVAVSPELLLYTLAQYDTVLERSGRTYPIVGQQIVVLDARGRILRSVDLVPLLAGFVPDERLRLIEKLAPLRGTKEQEPFVHATDVFHPNTVRLVRWPHAPGTGTGALVALREVDRVAVVDLERRALLWEWGAGEVIGPHDPWLLPNGNVVLFDNGARPSLPAAERRWSSRLVEVDPRTGRIVWRYPGDRPAPFSSPSRGGVQPLDDGNLLVTESTKGHVFEITRAGDVVWEFWNPDFDEGGVRRAIYRMHRITPAEYAALRGR